MLKKKIISNKENPTSLASESSSIPDSHSSLTKQKPFSNNPFVLNKFLNNSLSNSTSISSPLPKSLNISSASKLDLHRASNITSDNKNNIFTPPSSDIQFEFTDFPEKNTTNDQYGFLKTIPKYELEIPDWLTFQTSEFGFQPCRLVEEKQLVEAIPAIDLTREDLSFTHEQNEQNDLDDQNDLGDQDDQNDLDDRNEQDEQNKQNKEVLTKKQRDALINNIKIHPGNFNHYIHNFLIRVKIYQKKPPFDKMDENAMLIKLSQSITSKVYRLKVEFKNSNENELYALFASEISKVLINEKYPHTKNYTQQTLTNKLLKTIQSEAIGFYKKYKKDKSYNKTKLFNSPFTHFSPNKTKNVLRKAQANPYLQPMLLKK